MLIVCCFILAFTIYLIWILEEWKRKFPPKTKAIEYSLIIVEVQMFLSALSLIFSFAIWINASIAIAIGIWSFWYFPVVIEGLGNKEYALKQLREHDKLLREFKKQVIVMRVQKLKGCPMGLSCEQMGLRHKGICDNFKTCDRYYE